jgi:hypothetical protein
MKFPNLIHVVREQPERDEEYLAIEPEGVFSESFNRTKACAIYRLVDVGRVVVQRHFEGKRKSRA